MMEHKCKECGCDLNLYQAVSIGKEKVVFEVLAPNMKLAWEKAKRESPERFDELQPHPGKHKNTIFER